MNKFENDSFYEHKFCCFKTKYAEKCLTETELSILSVLLQKIEKNYPNRVYLCVNQDEPYADKVWELIKEGEAEKQQANNRRPRKKRQDLTESERNEIKESYKP